MSRQYVIGSWNDADQYDYSGEQVGQRNAPSKRIHFNADGTACVSSYADDEPKAKAKRSIMDKIDLANRHLNRMELMSAQLEHDFDSGSITLEEYSRGRRIMDERLDKAFKSVAKQEVWKDEDEQEAAPSYAWKESKAPVGTAYAEKDSIFLSLPVDNIFRRCYDTYTQAKKALNSLKGR